MIETAQRAHRTYQPSDYRCQFCTKKAIIQQAGLYLCASHARDEQPWPAEEIIELTEVVSDDLMPETVFAELYSGYGF